MKAITVITARTILIALVAANPESWYVEQWNF